MPVRRLLRRSTWRPAIPTWVLVAGLAATAASAVFAERSAGARARTRFETGVDEVAQGIVGRVETYLALLRAGAALFDANANEVDADQFRRFVERLDLRGRYPGIQGIGFAERVTRDELQRFVNRARVRLRPDFRIWPNHPRDDYYPIVYLEPQDRRNLAAIGYDMFTEPVRHAAMETAARTGTPTATGRVTLVQEIDVKKQAGFLIYLPVFEPGHASSGDRLLGFVYSPFRAGDLLSSVYEPGDRPALALAVYAGVATADRELLFDSHPAGIPPAAARFTGRRVITIAGQRWLVVVRSLPAFDAGDATRLLPWILVTGLLVTAGLTWAARDEARARAEAESAADRLRRSEEALRRSEVKLLRLVEAERAAHAEATAASRAKDDFLATLSHELRTPLNAILGWTAMLRDGRLDETQSRRALEVIARSARTQADLIEDLLDVSRIITGKMAITLHEMGLAGPVGAAVDAVRPTADAKGVALDSQLDADPPVVGDPDRLQQVAWNLLSNAIKFTPAGGRVTIRLRQADGMAELVVADTGIGMEAAFLPHVFERFRQHDSSTTRVHGGMGLGLAIVRHLVEAHGGSVRAESAGPGAGSTLVVALPLRAADRPLQAVQAAGRQPARAGDESGFKGIRALVVDDDPDARELMAEVLSDGGATVRTAASASEAIDILDREDIDVLLADIGMPGTDGYALLREVRRRGPDAVRAVPAIAVTAYAGEHDRRAAFDAGFQAHVAKPIDVNALRATVRRLVDA